MPPKRQKNSDLQPLEFDQPDLEDFGNEKKRKTKQKSASKKTKAPLDESEPSSESESEPEEVKKPSRAKSHHSAKRKHSKKIEQPIAPPPTPEKAPPREMKDEKEDETPEEEFFYHVCVSCNTNFQCDDGKMKLVGGKKKFKCSCPMVPAPGKKMHFFCSEKCYNKMQSQPESDDDGYNSV